jgi:polar amino acid transport system substrate-binding protein
MKCKNLFGAFCLLLGLAAHASEKPQLKISVGDWPPYLSSELKHNGVIAHLISDLLADEGYRVSFQFSVSALATGLLGGCRRPL